MGSLILCHKKRAKRPYEISRIHMRIYTMEELCYFICNNLYLIDYTIMNRRLCDWLEDELELGEMAEALRHDLDQNASLSEFVLTILKGSIIYAPSEIAKTQNILEHLQNQKEVEKAKYKADTLFKAGEYASAILVYQSVVNHEWDDSMDKSFYGLVYGCLGAAYGHLFLYEEAAEMYKKAYDICEDADMLKAYLYACMKAYPEERYTKMLSGNSAYLSANSQVREELEALKKEIDLDIDESRIERWKREYRRIDKRNV